MHNKIKDNQASVRAIQGRFAVVFYFLYFAFVAAEIYGETMVSPELNAVHYDLWSRIDSFLLATFPNSTFLLFVAITQNTWVALLLTGVSNLAFILGMKKMFRSSVSSAFILLGYLCVSVICYFLFMYAALRY